MEEAWEFAAVTREEEASAEIPARVSAQKDNNSQMMLICALITGAAVIIGAIITSFSGRDAQTPQMQQPVKQGASEEEVSRKYTKLSLKLENLSDSAASEAPDSVSGKSGEVILITSELELAEEDLGKAFRVGNFYSKCSFRTGCFNVCTQVLWHKREMRSCGKVFTDGRLLKEGHALRVGVIDFPDDYYDVFKVYVDGFAGTQSPQGMRELSSLVTPLYFKSEDALSPGQLTFKQGLVLDEFKKFPVTISGEVIDKRTLVDE